MIGVCEVCHRNTTVVTRDHITICDKCQEPLVLYGDDNDNPLFIRVTTREWEALKSKEAHLEGLVRDLQQEVEYHRGIMGLDT